MCHSDASLLQIAKALRFMHEKGIAHLDVKPDNIYVKNGVYKLGDFGCATLLDQSLPVEEGDARYMPQEILNEIFDHLDKVDIFSLGAAVYELIRGSPLPESGHPFLNLREGKLPLLPGHTLQFQNLLKVLSFFLFWNFDGLLSISCFFLLLLSTVSESQKIVLQFFLCFCRPCRLHT